MNMPGFTGESSLVEAHGHYRSVGAWRSLAGEAVVSQLGFGGFGPTLPSCHYEQRWVVCGSPLPGYPAPMCLDWVYVCQFPGSSRNGYGPAFLKTGS
jgi:hypothetical protein